MCEPIPNKNTINQERSEAIFKHYNGDNYCPDCGQGIKRCPRCGRIVPDSYVPYYPYIPYNPWPGWQTPYQPNPWYYQPTITWTTTTYCTC